MAKLTGIMDDYEAIIADDGSGLNEKWVHIGFISLSPYLPFFMGVTLVADPGEVASDTKRIYVKSTMDFEGLYEAFQPFAHFDRIEATFFKVEEAERPIAEFLPQPVPAIELESGYASGRFWPRVPPRRSSTRRGHGDEDEEPGPSDDDEVEEEGEAAAEEDEVEGTAEGVPIQSEALLDAVYNVYAEERPHPLQDADEGPEGVATHVVDGQGDEASHEPVPDPPRETAAATTTKRRRASQHNPDEAIIFASGMITFFSSNGNFQATCTVHGDQRCTLTRKGSAAQKQTRRGVGGRPLGLLAAWLSMGETAASKEEHIAPSSITGLAGADVAAYRRQMRAELADIPGSEILFAQERPKDDDETSEPDRVA